MISLVGKFIKIVATKCHTLKPRIYLITTPVILCQVERYLL